MKLVYRFVEDRARRGLAESSISFYRRKLSGFCRYVSKDLTNLSTDELLEALGRLPCNPGGKQAYLRALKAFYAWAHDAGLLASNPSHKVSIRVPKPLLYAVNVGDVQRLMKACRNDRDRLIVSLLADTGMRISELLSVKRPDINFDANIITIWGKGAKQRVVRYGPKTAELLASHLATSRNEHVAGITYNGAQAMLRRLWKRTGIKCNAHAFRRTFATECVRNGLNLFYVQSLLGHSTLEMTRIYAEQVDSEDAIKAYKPIVR